MERSCIEQGNDPVLAIYYHFNFLKQTIQSKKNKQINNKKSCAYFIYESL